MEETLNEYFGKRAPQLPASVKEIIVKFAPWVTLLILILALPAILVLLGIGSAMMPASFMMGPRTGIMYVISMIIFVVTLVLETMAIPGLMKRSKQGWNLIYYSTLIGFISTILSLNIINIIIGIVVPLYILFQIRSYYK